MSELKKGDRVRIRYWDELPPVRNVDWNKNFFERYSGMTGEIISNKTYDVLVEEKIQLKLKDGSYKSLNIYALTKLNTVPDELFEI